MTCRETDVDMNTELHIPIVVTDGGPWAEHDHACAVCSERSSILDIGTGVFQPCAACSRDGWEVVQKRRFGRFRRDTTT